MDMIGRIRRLQSRGKKSEREIARMTGLSRNTVAKWLEGPLQAPPKYRRAEQPGKLTAFHDAIKLALKADAHRPRHERRTARALHTEIRAAGYDGGYTAPGSFLIGISRPAPGSHLVGQDWPLPDLGYRVMLRAFSGVHPGVHRKRDFAGFSGISADR